MKNLLRCSLCILPLSTLSTTTSASEKPIDAMVNRGVNYLRANQSVDGSFSGFAGIGPTALVTTALLRSEVDPDDEVIKRALKYLESHIQSDGGIYKPGTFFRNYETCLSVLCFVEAKRGKRDKKTLDRAERFLKELQWDNGEGKTPNDLAYGGGGYGKNKRADLSNTSFLIDALRALGDDANDDSIQRALLFVSRCQNLESKHNTTEFASKNPDGGFYYTADAGGSSPAGETSNGGLRSYGAMTYAGLKSMLYAGVGPDDPRVKAAIQWAQKHYRLDQNPGLGTAGLYYYYHLFAKALAATRNPTITDANGKVHDWKSELVAALNERQRKDGSWANENDRWMENDPKLVTGYALLALSYCR